MTQTNRIYGLDILRSFAILFVVYLHGYYIISEHVDGWWYNLPVLDGVNLFFVLSGFLIGGIFMRVTIRDDFSFYTLKEFWLRRWFRTLPNYFLVLSILILVRYFNDLKQDPHLYKYFFFYHNFHERPPAFFPESWSLSVEEWFYLLIPLFIFVLIQLFDIKQRKAIILTIASVIIGCFIVRIYRIEFNHYTDAYSFDVYVRKQVICRLDSIVFGFLAAYILRYHSFLWQERRRLYFAMGVIFLLLPKFNEYLLKSELIGAYTELTFTSIGTMFMLPYLYSLTIGDGPLYKVFTFISKISYSMYLVHFSLILFSVLPYTEYFMKQVGWSPTFVVFINYITYWVLTILISYLLYTYFELPMTSLREKFTKKGN